VVHLQVAERFRIHAEPADEPRGHLCEPRMTRLKDGTVLLSFRTGSLRYSPDGSPRILRSNDEGATWTDLGRPLDGLLPGRPGWDYRAAALTELRSGAILLCSVGLDRSSPDRPPWLVYNPDPAAFEGMIPIQNLVFRSEDGGRSWSEPWPMTGLTVPNSSAQVLVTLANGDVVGPLETFKAFDEPGPWRYRVDVIRSHDEGRTWGESAPAHMSDPETDPRNLMCWDPRMALLPDGRLVQTYYAFLNRTGGEDPIHIGWSTDGGRTWSVPRSTGIRGQAMFPIALPGGDLIGFFQRRHDPQGVVAAYSPDGGATFDPTSVTDVYLHPRPSASGFDTGADPVAYMNDMIHFTFGHPTGVALDDRRALVVWYAGDEIRTEIWGAILTVT
jgi:sialidase-1